MRGQIFFALVAQVAAYTDIDVNMFMYKNIDPIVYPGQYDKSHLHTFFGSDAITIDTTTSAELQAGCSTAENPNDFSTYWVPTLLYTADDGSSYDPVPIMRFTAYYNLGASPAEVAIPQDLMMKAGNAEAQTSDEMDTDAKIEWFCEGDDAPADKDAAAFPTSTCSTHLQTLVYFPNCVNEDTLETAYTSSSYGTDNWCPSDMSVMPQLRFSIRYDLRDALPDGWSGEAPFILSSGTSFSSHGDFINGWLPEAATNMIATTEEKYEFSGVSGENGDDGDGSVCTSTATDADPDNGTSDYATSVADMSSKRRVGSRFRGRRSVLV
ncbi:unnamed protein product [Discula destructiva]